MKQYKLQNLCCRGCAAQMEQNIGVLPGVKGASIDFEESLLKIYGEKVSLDELKQIVQKIEPQVEVVEISLDENIPTSTEEDRGFLSSLFSRENLPELRKLIFASLLFAGGMLFEDLLRSTPWSAGYYGVFLAAYLICGLDVIKSAVRNLAGGNLFDEFFLMTLATFAAIALGFMGEAVGVMLFYSVGEFFQDLAASNSRNSIKSLLSSRPTTAHLLRNGELTTITPEEAAVGDVLMVRPGEKIPLDGKVLTGSSQVDTSPLTGEPVPISAEVGESLYGGSINLSGVLTIRVTAAYQETAIARILEMVEFAVAQKSPTERFITKFARYYTPIVVIMALFVAFLPPLLGMGSFSSWIYKAIVLLIISCPCALMVSIPLGYFGGIGAASKHGLLVKGGNVLDALNEVTTVIFDKTGTLTKGVFEVTSLRPVTGVTPEKLLEMAALAEMNSNHPIARSIMKAFGRMPEKINVEMKEIPGKGVEAVHDGRTILAGTASLLNDKGILTQSSDDSGTVVHVAVDGKYQGYLVVSDIVKEDSSLAVKKLKKLGVRTVSMLTGDRYGVASSVSSSLGLDSFKAELLPHQKVDQVRSLKEKAGGGVIFAGDGINDAPSLATADVGIAMGGLGSEAAIETADLVILSDRPSEVADAISLARQTRRIVWQNIILALGVKAAVLLLGVAGISGLWEAVFADVGVALLAVLNSARTVRMSVVTQS